MDPNILLLLSPEKKNPTEKIKMPPRRPSFESFLYSEGWVTIPVASLDETLDRWEEYVESPSENLSKYFDIKQELDSLFPGIGEYLCWYTTFLHQTSYLLKNGLTDTSNFIR